MVNSRMHHSMTLRKRLMFGSYWSNVVDYVDVGMRHNGEVILEAASGHWQHWFDICFQLATGNSPGTPTICADKQAELCSMPLWMTAVDGYYMGNGHVPYLVLHVLLPPSAC